MGSEIEQIWNEIVRNDYDEELNIKLFIDLLQERSTNIDVEKLNKTKKHRKKRSISAKHIIQWSFSDILCVDIPKKLPMSNTMNTPSPTPQLRNDDTSNTPTPSPEISALN